VQAATSHLPQRNMFSPATSFRLRISGVLLVIVMTAAACLTQGALPSLDKQAQEIDRSLMCPVCPSETIDQSQVPLAKQMRTAVRERLADGQSRQEILDYFVDSYGSDILAAPTKSGFNLVAWSVPGLGILAGGVTLALVLRRMRAHPTEAVPAVAEPQASDELDPYLVIVDEEIRQALEGGRSTGQVLPAGERGEE